MGISITIEDNSDVSMPYYYLKLQRFVVSRNPWHRLVSAWSDKFNMGGGWTEYWMRAMCGGKTWESCPPFRYVMHVLTFF